MESHNFGRIVLNRGKRIKRKLSGPQIGPERLLRPEQEGGVKSGASSPTADQLGCAARRSRIHPGSPSRKQTRICHLDRSVIAQQHITRMEVAMGQRSFFSVMQGLEDPFQQPGNNQQWGIVFDPRPQQKRGFLIFYDD